MISLALFAETHKNLSLEELIRVRDELFGDVLLYENEGATEAQKFMEPGPEVIYWCNLQYLAITCQLMADKYVKEEYVDTWVEEE